MRWIALVVTSLFVFSSASAFDEAFATDEEMLTLDSEIEAILEEEGFDESAPSFSIQSNVEKIEVEELSEESIGLEVDRIAAEDEPMVVQAAPLLDSIKEETTKAIDAIEINLRQVFSGSPIIYSILFLLSTVSICVWLYSMLTIRSVEFLPPKLIKELRTKLVSNQFDEALDLCVKQKHFFCKMLASGILARRHGLNVMVDTMKSEGKRSTVAFWQRINILNEIAVIAPMLGLLGTVLGMFYAFYDLNRSVESVSLLFDGLGISVGTTVAGLIVAILAMILYSVAKYRLVRILANVENEAQTFAALIDTRGPTYLEK